MSLAQHSTRAALACLNPSPQWFWGAVVCTWQGPCWQPEHHLQSFWKLGTFSSLEQEEAQFMFSWSSVMGQISCNLPWVEYLLSCVFLWADWSDSQDEATASRAPRDGQASLCFSCQRLGAGFQIPTAVGSRFFMAHLLSHTWTDRSEWMLNPGCLHFRIPLPLPRDLCFLGSGFSRSSSQSWWNINRTVLHFLVVITALSFNGVAVGKTSFKSSVSNSTPSDSFLFSMVSFYLCPSLCCLIAVGHCTHSQEWTSLVNFKEFCGSCNCQGVSTARCHCCTLADLLDFVLALIQARWELLLVSKLAKPDRLEQI